MVAKNYFVMDVEAPFLAEKAIAGNFVSLKVQDNVTDPLLKVPLGIHKHNESGISVLYKVIGEGTRLLSKRRAGEEVEIMGPLGNAFSFNDLTEAEVIIAAGGHGIAPLYLLAESILKEKPSAKIHFLIGACTKEEILCAGELEKMGCEVKISTDDGSHGCRGYVTDLIQKLLDEKEKSGEKLPEKIFACGPRAMLSAVNKVAEKAKIPLEVSLDAYMACGIGACLGCAVRTKGGYKMVCKDGPVFSSDEIDWDLAAASGAECVCE